MKSTKAIFAGGCFWCTEAIYKRVKGVTKITPGYAGDGEKPTYEEVAGGKTNFREAIQIEYSPKVITFTKLLEIFFKIHDPTSFDKQGADIGPQYRSVIFYTEEQQKKIANSLIKEIDDKKVLSSKIVTEVVEFKKFYEAESYHKDFYAKNPDNPYCTIVINPKLEKLVKEFREDVK